MKGVESSVVHYGDTTLTFLSNLQKADDAGQGLTYVSAVTVEEKSVWDYNQGNPSGDPATLGQHAKPEMPLVAVYPKEGTLLSDNPWVVLQADWVDDAQAGGRGGLPGLRAGRRRSSAFADAAFRSFDGTAGGADHPGRRAAAGPAEDRRSPRPHRRCCGRAGVLGAAPQAGQGAAGARRLRLDGRAVGSAGATKLELAKKAAASVASTCWRPTTRSSLWVFSTEQGGEQALPRAGAVRAGRADAGRRRQGADGRPRARRRHRPLRDHPGRGARGGGGLRPDPHQRRRAC